MPIRTARLSSESSTTGERVPSGRSISWRFQTRIRQPYLVRLDSAPMPPAVDTLLLGPAGTNCYSVRADRGSPEAVVVDPSGDAAEIRLQLAGMGARCAAILVTHGHWDHLVGVADLAEGTGAPVYMPAGERFALEEPAIHTGYAPVAIRAYTPDVVLEGGEKLELAGIAFDVIAVPGHSPAHLAYQADGVLLSGDVLFAGSVGRTDVPGGDWSVLLASIRSLAEAFPAETVVYPGHGPATTLGAELARNPFLAELRAEQQA
jgi:glyoxylase-like metal-dependent hydrolase (beta-lactamase superfamily II)